MADQPTGMVTLVFTDIEGSTRLVQQLGRDAYGGLLAHHHTLLRSAIAACAGVEIKTEGDSFFVVFALAADALLAATQAQRALAHAEWPDGVRVAVRMGIHTGEVELRGGEYIGLDIHRAARISAAAHGGQVLLSSATQALTTASLPEGVTTRDLGEHRLKDIEDPEHLFQLVIDGLPSEFPALRALATRLDLLPPELSTFVGRETELARGQEMLGRTRLLTLTGPGGTGKTRLAISLARSIGERFADGVAFVPLAPITNPDLVLTTVMKTLNLTEQPGQTSLDAIVERLSGRDVLIVLDNFEQVVDAAPSISQLLERVPSLTLVVTSRVPLHLTGEQEFPVPPLALPYSAETDNERLYGAESVQLFAQRARAVVPSFELTADNITQVAEICRRVDGLPLAIELAASRVKLLPPAALLARLEKSLEVLQSTAADRSDRQRTLRGAIAWSYDLLGPAEQAVFRQLAIFVGGWSFEDADAVVAQVSGPGVDLLEALSALVDHSLVRQIGDADEARFMMLEVIREYGLEQLSASGRLEACADAHAARFALIAEQAEPRLTSGREELDALEREHDNLRAALAWLDEHDAQAALLMGGRLWRFWHLRGHLREGASVLRALLAKPAAAEPNTARAKALVGLAGIVYWQGDYTLAERSYTEALAIARQGDDEELAVEVLYSLAYVRAIGADYAGAIQDLREAREIYLRKGNELMANWALVAIGMAESLSGDHETALEILGDSLSGFDNLGDSFGLRNTLGVRTRALMQLGRLDDAAADNRRLVELALDVGDITAMSQALLDAASLAALSDDLERAAVLMGAARRIVEESGGEPPPELVNRVEAMPRLERDVAPGRLAELLAIGRAMTNEDASGLALGEKASSSQSGSPQSTNQRHVPSDGAK